MPRTLTPERCNVRKLTGLTDRQLELLVAVAAHARAYGTPVRANAVSRFLAERPSLALVEPCPRVIGSYQRSYQNATMRLLRLGYVKTRCSDERTCLLSMTEQGWAKLRALAGGEVEPPDILDVLGIGRGVAWASRPKMAVGT
jgi:hypothetical protein